MNVMESLTGMNRSSLGALVVVVLALAIGWHLPVPLMPAETTAALERTASAYPLLWLCFSGWLNAVFLLEAIRIVFPSLLPNGMQRNDHINPYARTVIGCGLLLACVYGFNFLQTMQRWSSLEGIDFPQTDQLAVFISLLGGFSALIFLGLTLDRLVAGCGLWLLIAFDDVRTFSLNWSALPKALEMDVSLRSYALWSAFWFILCVIVFVALLTFRRKNHETGFTDVLWPLLAAWQVTYLVLWLAEGSLPDFRIYGEFNFKQSVGFALYIAITLALIDRQNSDARFRTTRLLTFAAVFFLLAIDLALEFQPRPLVLQAPSSLIILMGTLALWLQDRWRDTQQSIAIRNLSLRR